MNFLPSSSTIDRCYIGEVLPEFEHLLLPFTKNSVQTIGDFGSILTQGYTADDYSIWHHHFFISQGGPLYAKSDRATLAINYMLQGSPTASLIGVGEHLLEEDTYQLFYLPRGQQEVWFDPGEYRCLHINFEPTYLKKIARGRPALERLVRCATLQSEGILPYAKGPIATDVKSRLQATFQSRGNDGELELQMKVNVIELLLLYLRKHHLNGQRPLARIDKDRLHEVYIYIENNLHGEFRIVDIAKKFKISPSTLRRHFAATYNMPIYQFYHERRMRQACQLLIDGRMTISEISDAMGYKNYTSFSRAFTKYHGLPPVKYNP